MPRKKKRLRTSVKRTCHSVSVGITLEGPSLFHSNVVSLLLAELRQLGAQGWKVKAGDFLVQILWQKVDIVLVTLVLFPVLEQVKLCKHLVGEGTRHDKGWMASGATQIQETA